MHLVEHFAGRQSLSVPEFYSVRDDNDLIATAHRALELVGRVTRQARGHRPGSDDMESRYSDDGLFTRPSHSAPANRQPECVGVAIHRLRFPQGPVG